MLDEYRLLEIFMNYISNDYEDTNATYVLDALKRAGAEREDIIDLGYDFLFKEVNATAWA